MVRNLLVRSAVASLAFAVYLAVASFAQAGFISDFTGWTMMSDVPATSGVVNFAVYDNTGGGNWETMLGITGDTSKTNLGGNPAPTVDATAKYVYFYEVVNAGTNSLTSLTIPGYSTPFSSGGFLSGTVFNNGSAVGPSGNQYIGDAPSGTPPDNQQYWYPSASGVSLPNSSTAFTTATAAAPVYVDLGGPNGVITPNSAVFQFIGNTLGVGKFSDVLFLTSDTSPGYVNGSVASGTPSSDGNIPSQSPEPATLAMWGLGAVGFGLVARRRKKAQPVSC